ncbi:GNAT family N-acetyltransferase [Aquidulcibacter sp.]|uniref:GNAT family N-acetyltransferase n=1 Tax=Aquidulcibacter sp. TaxID=2052990 RepID=UPI003BA60222
MKLFPVTAHRHDVSLTPLVEADREALRAAASDPALFRYWPRDMAADKWDQNFDWMLQEQAAGRWLFHTVKAGDGRIVGQTCYLAIRPEHKGVEIGGTWYVADVHGTQVNPTCKLVLLENAFACGAERVELKTDARNSRSRAAILKLGASFEGIFRRHLLLPDGQWRDTAWFSILRDEWPKVKTGLEARLAR